MQIWLYSERDSLTAWLYVMTNWYAVKTNESFFKFFSFVPDLYRIISKLLCYANRTIGGAVEYTESTSAEG